jgi:hypothetical protein
MHIFRGVDFNLQFSASQSEDFEADSEVDSQRVRGTLRLLPRPNITMNATAEYNTSDTTFAAAEDISSESTFGSIDFTWAISDRLDFFLDLDYIRSDSAGTKTDEVSYLSNLIWQMNDKLIFFLGYRGGTEDEEVRSFRTQAKFPFIWDTRLSINYEIERGQQTDTQFLFTELTKVF